MMARELIERRKLSTKRGGKIRRKEIHFSLCEIVQKYLNLKIGDEGENIHDKGK
jgi:hypothetical protein